MQLKYLFKLHIYEKAKNNIREKVVEPICYVPFCGIYTELQTLGARGWRPHISRGDMWPGCFDGVVFKSIALYMGGIGARGSVVLLSSKMWPPEAAVGSSILK